MKFDTSKWGEFKLVDLFNYERGTRLTKNDRIEGKYPLVTAGEYNQGVKEYINNENQKIFRNAITIDMFCNCFVHIEDFCCDDNVLVLTAKQNISKWAMQFISTIINKDKEKWRYIKQYRQNSLKKHSIFLPCNKENKPDFEFMESFIKNIQKEHALKLLKSYEVLKANRGGIKINAYKDYVSSVCNNINSLQWKEFKVGDLFVVKSNPQLNKNSFEFLENGEYPYFTRTVYNNGILGYVKYLDDEHKIKGNSIAVGLIAMQFFYIQKDFYAGQFTKTIYPKFENFNKYVAFYFISLFNKHKQTYLKDFVVKYFERDFANTYISLPTDCENNPHFAFIENFIKIIEKEVIKSVNLWSKKRINATKAIIDSY